MKTAIRYYTRSGNTEKLAKAIAEALNAQAETIEQPLAEKTDILFLGCSYYAFDMAPQVKQFIDQNKDKISEVVCFGTSAMMKSMKRPMEKVLRGTGIRLSEKEFHCRGQFKMAHPGRPNADDMRSAAEFAKSIIK